MLIDKELITVPEFLKYFSICRTSFYEQCAAGRITLVKRGSRSFVTREDALKWLQNLPRKTGRSAA